MVIFIMENGKMEKNMVEEFTIQVLCFSTIFTKSKIKDGVKIIGRWVDDIQTNL